MRGRSRLQHSSVQPLPSHRVEDPTLSLCLHRVFHCSDDFLHSSSLKSSCPGTKHPRPVAPSSVFATEALGLASRRKRSKSESSVVSSWCVGHLCPAGAYFHQLETYPSHSLPFGSFVPPASAQLSVGFQKAASAASSLCLICSFISVTCWINAAARRSINSGLTTQTQTNQESTARSSAHVSSMLPNFFGHDEFSCVDSLEVHQSCQFDARATVLTLPCD